MGDVGKRWRVGGEQWLQQQLFQGPPVEVTLRVAFHHHAQTTMYMVTATRMDTAELIGMMSWPYVDDDSRPRVLDEVVRELDSWHRTICEPFPESH